MKRNAIVRIIIFSIISLLLLSILVVGIAAKSFSFTEQGGTLGSVGTADPSRIRNIDIEWVSGSVTVVPGRTDVITFAETEGLPEKDQMLWSISGNTLKIQFCKTNKIVSFGINISTPDKDLVITVPQEWAMDALDIESVSADLQISQLTAGSMEIENVSGECNIDHCISPDLHVETVSGNVHVTGECSNIEISSVSASCTVFPGNVPNLIKLDSVSGDLELYFFEECPGFTASLDSLSGHVTSEFPTTMSGNNHTYGDGSCRVMCESVSGNLFIRIPRLEFTDKTGS